MININLINAIHFEPYSICKEFVFIGHPRFGSGYLAGVLTRAGLPTGHERVKSSGAASWLYAVDSHFYPYGDNNAYHKYTFNNVYLFIKDPLHSLPSCILENSMPKSYLFRKKHIERNFDFNLDVCTTDVDKAVASIILWYKICELKRPVDFVKIDDKASILRILHKLGVKDHIAIENALSTPIRNTSENKWKNKSKPKLNDELVAAIDNNLAVKLAELCKAYGYVESYDRIKRIHNILD